MSKTTFMTLGIARDAAVSDSHLAGTKRYVAPSPGGGWWVLREKTPECQYVTQLIMGKWIAIDIRISSDYIPGLSGT